VPEGERLARRLEARWIRKHPSSGSTGGSTWWAPRARGWWIAVLFALGSVLFALGAFPLYATSLGAAIQLAGTIFFNRSTANECRVDLTAQTADQIGWRPDAVGSVCFLVASLSFSSSGTNTSSRAGRHSA